MKLLILFVLATALLVGCTGNAASGVQDAQNDGNSTGSPGKIVEFTITAKPWDFNPNVITVKKGDHVKLTLSSIEGTHGFSLPEYNVNQKLVAGAAPITVEFVADKAGEFPFRCNVMCGSGHKTQTGKLIVTE
jgi:cytochrome c oxidase subunit 2